jgi:hypothetical protein
MLTVEELERRQSATRFWMFAVCSAVVTLFGEICFALFDQADRVSPRLAELQFVHAGLAALILGWLLTRRALRTTRQALIAGLLLLVPLVFILWYAQEVARNAGFRWDPFIGHRLAILTAAILFPARPKTVILVVLGLTALGLLHFALWGNARSTLGRFDEPWLTVIYGGIGSIVVLLRLRIQRLEGVSRRAHAALVTIGHLATATRALRDGANTALQTIDAVAFILRNRHPDSEDDADRLSRCVAQLRRVLETLRFEDLVEWEKLDVSGEAGRRLAELEESLLKDVREPRSRKQPPDGHPTAASPEHSGTPGSMQQ